MTKTESKILAHISNDGFVTVLANSAEHKAAYKMAKLFGWIERETVVGVVNAYQYRLCDQVRVNLEQLFKPFE